MDRRTRTLGKHRLGQSLQAETELVRPGGEIARQRTARRLPRHRHEYPYAALVLRGAYVESGDRGRFRVTAGDILFHGPFEAHQDIFETHGADILNLVMTPPAGVAAGRIADLDAVARAAEHDPVEAAAMVAAGLDAGPQGCADWPDLLAADLAANEVTRLSDWAARHRLDRATVSRGFRAAYGVSPRRYRLEQRARRAAIALGTTAEPLALVAARHGFADQSHMTRTLKRLFGRPPRRLRA